MTTMVDLSGQLRTCERGSRRLLQTTFGSMGLRRSRRGGSQWPAPGTRPGAGRLRLGLCDHQSPVTCGSQFSNLADTALAPRMLVTPLAVGRLFPGHYGSRGLAQPHLHRLHPTYRRLRCVLAQERDPARIATYREPTPQRVQPCRNVHSEQTLLVRRGSGPPPCFCSCQPRPPLGSAHVQKARLSNRGIHWAGAQQRTRQALSLSRKCPTHAVSPKKRQTTYRQSRMMQAL